MQLPAGRHEDLVELQTACAQWMMTVLEFLDAFNGQLPVTGRANLGDVGSRLDKALAQLRSATLRCSDSAVGVRARNLVEMADRLGAELARDHSPSKASLLIQAHRQLHIGYAELMLVLGDELARLSLPQPRLSA